MKTATAGQTVIHDGKAMKIIAIDKNDKALCEWVEDQPGDIKEVRTGVFPVRALKEVPSGD